MEDALNQETELAPSGKDFYYRLTTEDADGNISSFIECRRVWNAELFLAQLQKDYRNETEKDGVKRTVTMASRAEYMATKRRAA
jgi:hypothetical protein